MNNECLIKKRILSPEANNIATPTTKSQLEVCGAKVMMYFLQLGNSPVTCQPIMAKTLRPSHFENALPPCGDWFNSFTPYMGSNRYLLFAGQQRTIAAQQGF